MPATSCKINGTAMTSFLKNVLMIILTLIQLSSSEVVVFCPSTNSSVITPVDNAQVRIECSSKRITLNQTYFFENASNFSLSSIGETVLHCQDSTEAGLSFVNIMGLKILNLTIENCGIKCEIDEGNNTITASIFVYNCTSVYIEGTKVDKSPGTGLALFNIDTSIDVKNSIFSRNGWDHNSGGNGINLEVTENCYKLKSSIRYNFVRCSFTNNTATTDRDANINGFSRFDKGGGLCVILRSQEIIEVFVVNSTVTGNKASSYGGGVYTSFQNDVRNSSFIIEGSTFTFNNGQFGGAHHMGFLHNRHKQQTPLRCTFRLLGNKYTTNSAVYGGAVSIFSTKVKESTNSINISFENCKLNYNRGLFGSAVAILPNAWNLHSDGYLPEIFFSNCFFNSNYIRNDQQHTDRFSEQYVKGYGAMYVTDHILHFDKSNSFLSNNGSALYIGTSRVYFNENSRTNFTNNTSHEGGAIYQMSSIIYFDDNSVTIFDGNKADSKGGAVYHTSHSFHTYNYSKTCFFTYNDKIKKEGNVTITFSNNVARRYGHSIYTYSLVPCYQKLRFEISDLESTPHELLQNISYYPVNRKMEIATDVYDISFKHQDEYLAMLPGKKTALLRSERDELEQEAKNVYQVTLVHFENQSTIEIDQAYTYITGEKIKLYGKPGDEAKLILSASSVSPKALSFKVKMLPCPPGYIFNESLMNCVCAYDTKSNYVGIRYCESGERGAQRTKGYWVGYSLNESESENSLLTGFCPTSYCVYNSSTSLLPPVTNTNVINSRVCHALRMGYLCGQCIPNSSVYYHSLHFECKPNKHCSIGWLFFIASELIPVTIVFLAIVAFNISFTSGAINGFVFYSQVVTMLHVTADDYIQLQPALLATKKVLQFVYLSFNMDMFVLDSMSFCLYKGATTLDIVAFNYITLVYTFILILGTITLFNKLNMRYCCKPFWKCCRSQRKQSLHGNIIHGLTSFLVLCYAKCARASILLISYAAIYGKGRERKSIAVFYHGNIPWLSREHLIYAIPAIFFLLVISFMPLLFLFIYPLHYKVLSVLRLSESRFFNILFSPLEKVKPLLDSFQSCFKDEFRFFSGLYFLYRFLILLNVSFNTIKESYFILLAQILAMLLLHGVCQPYKHRLHNIIDTLIFINLGAINAITMYNFSNANYHKLQSVTDAYGWIQMLLIALPLIVLLIVIIIKIVKEVKRWYARRVTTVTSTPDVDPMYLLLDELHDLRIRTGYKKAVNAQL